MKRSPLKARSERKRQEPMPDDVAQRVMRRSRGMCELCGVKQATNLHHRKPRSQGGEHTVENLVALCGMGNTSGCHGLAHTHTDRYVKGWLVKRGDDPALVDFER